MSRRTKAPSEKALMELDLCTLLAGEVRDALKDCNVPELGDAEVNLLVKYFLNPLEVDAIDVKCGPNGLVRGNLPVKVKGKKIAADKKVLQALLFAKLFAHGGDAMIYALPKIHRRVMKFFRSPVARLITELILQNGWGKCFPGDHWQEFWTAKTHKVAMEYSDSDSPITPKIVEKARALIRKRISPKA